MKAKLISLLGYFGQTNTGDEAILHCLIEQLKQMHLKQEVVVFSGNPISTSETYGVASVYNILPTSLPRFIVGALGRNRRNFFRALMTFCGSDTLIVGGGGLFFDSLQTNKYLLELLKKIDWAKKMGKKVVLLGVGIGPIHHTKSKLVLSNVLNKVDLITVRDRDSLELLSQLGIVAPRIHLTADFAFLMQPKAIEDIEEILREEKLEIADMPRIGICLCGRHVKVPNLKKSIIGFCKYATGEIGAQVWFIPMQTGGGDDDRIGLNLIMNEFEENNRVFFLKGDYNPEEILGIMSYTNAIIGERFHASIFSLINNIPFLGIAYMPKVESLFKEMGHREWYIKLDEIDEATLIMHFSQIWRNSKPVKEELAKFRSFFQKRALKNFSLLANLLGIEQR
jgi:polysaccharide pyruvyl transferase WcaK-like protein